MTKTGDRGTTGLWGKGIRVSKSDRRIETLGWGDTLTTELGALTLELRERGLQEADYLHKLQRLMIDIMGDVSIHPTPEASALAPETLAELEEKAKEIEKTVVPPEGGWSLSGANRASLAADRARCACRHFERLATEQLPAAFVSRPFVNRLSDYLWLLGRRCEALSN